MLFRRRATTKSADSKRDPQRAERANKTQREQLPKLADFRPEHIRPVSSCAVIK
jgi:hypothetical protein